MGWVLGVLRLRRGSGAARVSGVLVGCHRVHHYHHYHHYNHHYYDHLYHYYYHHHNKTITTITITTIIIPILKQAIKIIIILTNPIVQRRHLIEILRFQ